LSGVEGAVLGVSGVLGVLDGLAVSGVLGTSGVLGVLGVLGDSDFSAGLDDLVVLGGVLDDSDVSTTLEDFGVFGVSVLVVFDGSDVLGVLGDSSAALEVFGVFGDGGCSDALAVFGFFGVFGVLGVSGADDSSDTLAEGIGIFGTDFFPFPFPFLASGVDSEDLESPADKEAFVVSSALFLPLGELLAGDSDLASVFCFFSGCTAPSSEVVPATDLDRFLLGVLSPIGFPLW